MNLGVFLRYTSNITAGPVGLKLLTIVSCSSMRGQMYVSGVTKVNVRVGQGESHMGQQLPLVASSMRCESSLLAIVKLHNCTVWSHPSLYIPHCSTDFMLCVIAYCLCKYLINRFNRYWNKKVFLHYYLGTKWYGLGRREEGNDLFASGSIGFSPGNVPFYRAYSTAMLLPKIVYAASAIIKAFLTWHVN